MVSVALWSHTPLPPSHTEAFGNTICGNPSKAPSITKEVL